MKPSWKHSQYYTFTQSFPTASLICMASIPTPSERLDGFFCCSSTHRNEEQIKSREVSGLPESPSPGSLLKSVPAGEPAHISACTGTQTLRKASPSISTQWRRNGGVRIARMEQLLWERTIQKGNFPSVGSYPTLWRNWFFFFFFYMGP